MRSRGLVAAALLAASAGLAVYTLWPPAPFAPRDRPLAAFADPREMRRIVVLGTSLSARYDWPDRVRDRLQACLGRPLDLQVIARPGANAGWGLDQLPRVVAADPDLVVIEFSINDADLKDGLGRAASAERHRAILAGLADSGSRTLLMTMSPVRGWQVLFRPRLAAYYALYPALGRETGSGVLDLYPRWLAAAPGRDAIPDGLHPTPDAVAAILPEPLIGMIAAALGRRCPA